MSESDNVRCAGGGQWYETWEDAEIGADRNVPCGWSDYRYTFHPVWIGPSWIGKRNPDWEQAVTRKPCPECGGQVEVNN